MFESSQCGLFLHYCKSLNYRDYNVMCSKLSMWKWNYIYPLFKNIKKNSEPTMYQHIKYFVPKSVPRSIEDCWLQRKGNIAKISWALILINICPKLHPSHPLFSGKKAIVLAKWFIMMCSGRKPWQITMILTYLIWVVCINTNTVTSNNLTSN